MRMFIMAARIAAERTFRLPNFTTSTSSTFPLCRDIHSAVPSSPGPCIITVAITGSVPRKENNPAVPITVSEQVESTHAAYEAGAAMVHVHVRNDDQSTTSNPEKFAAFKEQIRRYCPDIILQ